MMDDESVVEFLDEVVCRCEHCKGTLDKSKLCDGCKSADATIKLVRDKAGRGGRKWGGK